MTDRAIGFPVIDRDNGGTLKRTLDALAFLFSQTDANTKVVPPHGAVGDRSASA